MPALIIEPLDIEIVEAASFIIISTSDITEVILHYVDEAFREFEKEHFLNGPGIH